jgi:ribosomal-protein-alanine N-acetyltransferase
MDYFNQETDRLILRKLTLEDIPSWMEFFEGNDFLHFVGINPEQPHHEVAIGWISRQLERYEESDLGMLAIVEKDSGQLVGLSGIIPREVDNENYYEIAYSFKPKVWGKGYATEAASMLKEFGFDSGLSDQFISIIDLDNFASQAVARKNGMEILRKTNYMDMEVFIFAVSK